MKLMCKNKSEKFFFSSIAWRSMGPDKKPETVSVAAQEKADVTLNSLEQARKQYIEKRTLFTDQLQRYANMDPSVQKELLQYGVEKKDFIHIQQNAENALAAIQTLPDSETISSINLSNQRFIDESLRRLSAIYRNAILYDRSADSSTQNPESAVLREVQMEPEKKELVTKYNDAFNRVKNILTQNTQARAGSIEGSQLWTDFQKFQNLTGNELYDTVKTQKDAFQNFIEQNKDGFRQILHYNVTQAIRKALSQSGDNPTEFFKNIGPQILANLNTADFPKGTADRPFTVEAGSMNFQVRYLGNNKYEIALTNYSEVADQAFPNFEKHFAKKMENSPNQTTKTEAVVGANFEIQEDQLSKIPTEVRRYVHQHALLAKPSGYTENVTIDGKHYRIEVIGNPKEPAANKRYLVYQESWKELDPENTSS